MCTCISHSYTGLILAQCIVRDPIEWGFTNFTCSCTHDIGRASMYLGIRISERGNSRSKSGSTCGRIPCNLVLYMHNGLGAGVVSLHGGRPGLGGRVAQGVAQRRVKRRPPRGACLRKAWSTPR